jgi:hypothetical protein
MMMFRSRNEWFGHELQNHRREWVCQYCHHVPFLTAADFSKHISTSHPAVLASTQIQAVLLQSEEPVDTISAFACPLCDEWEEGIKTRQGKQEGKIRMLNHGEMVEPYGTKKQFRRHLGRHMEQLALFALPTNNAELDDDSTSGEEDDQSDHRESQPGPIDRPSPGQLVSPKPWEISPVDTLFCGNLSFQVTEDIIREAFSQHGTVVSVRLPVDM